MNYKNYINDPHSFADWQNNVKLLKLRIKEQDAVIGHLKQTLIAVFAGQYRDDGAGGQKALEMAREDAEREHTVAVNLLKEQSG